MPHPEPRTPQPPPLHLPPFPLQNPLLRQISPVFQHLVRGVDADLRPRDTPEQPICRRLVPGSDGPGVDGGEGPEAEKEADVVEEGREGFDGACGVEEMRVRGDEGREDGLGWFLVGEEGRGSIGRGGFRGGNGEAARCQAGELGVEEVEGVGES